MRTEKIILAQICVVILLLAVIAAGPVAIGQMDPDDSHIRSMGHHGGHIGGQEPHMGHMSGGMPPLPAGIEDIAVGHESEEGLIRCKRPICDLYCPYGFQTGEDGCTVCECERNPCEVISCVTGLICRPKRCNGGACPVPAAECVEDDDVIAVESPMRPCPMPMCAEDCPYGFKTNEQGCMTCQCKQEPIRLGSPTCETTMCDEGLVCFMKQKDGYGPASPVCTVPSLCQSERENIRRALDAADVAEVPQEINSLPLCREDGTFAPRQCNDVTQECWCVDDRGKRLPSNTDDAGTPACETKQTAQLHITLALVHDFEHDELIATLDEGNLHIAIREYVSYWMAVKSENIMMEEPIPAEGRLLVRIVVLADGVTDLPSAANHLGNWMRQGRCDIPFQDRILTPDPDSIKVHHRYIVEPHLPPQELHEEDSGFQTVWRDHKIALLIGSIGAIIFLLMMITLCAYVCIRRKKTNVQSVHKKYPENLKTGVKSGLPDLVDTQKSCSQEKLLPGQPIV